MVAPARGKDVDDWYVDEEGPKRQDETSRDKTRRAGHTGLESVESAAHVGKALERFSELWGSGRDSVSDGKGGTHSGPSTATLNDNDEPYAKLAGEVPALGFDTHAAGQASEYALPAHFSQGATEANEHNVGVSGGTDGQESGRSLTPMLMEPLNEARSAAAWGEKRDIPRIEALAGMDKHVGDVDSDENERMADRGKQSAEITNMLDSIAKTGTGTSGDGGEGAGARDAEAVARRLKRAEEEAMRADDNRIRAEMDAAMGKDGSGDRSSRSTASNDDGRPDMRADAERHAARLRDARPGPGPCSEPDGSGDCSDLCRVGTWRAVEPLVRAGIIVPLSRHIGQGAADLAGDRATALDNVNDAVHGIKSRLSVKRGAPGGFVCLSDDIAKFLVAAAETFRGVRVAVASLSGGSHGGHTSHYAGRAIDIASIAGVPLTRKHRALSLAVAKVCKENGAVAVFNVNLECGKHCEQHATSVHCTFPGGGGGTDSSDDVQSAAPCYD